MEIWKNKVILLIIINYEQMFNIMKILWKYIDNVLKTVIIDYEIFERIS